MKRKILIVDDERMIRLGLISMIEEIYLDTYIIIEAKNGQEALDIASIENPDMIFLDVRMPIKDGLTALPELKNIVPEVPIILLTGFSEFEYAKTAIKYGVQDYLLKPCSLSDIKTAIDKMEQTLLEKNATQSAYFSVNMTSTLDLYFNKEILPEESFEFFPVIGFCIFYIDIKDRMQAGLYCKSIINSFFEAAFPKNICRCTYFLPTGELCLITAGDSAKFLAQFMNTFQFSAFSGTSAVFFQHTVFLNLLRDISTFQDQNYLRCFLSGTGVSYYDFTAYTDKNSEVFSAFASALERTALSYLLNDTASYITDRNNLLLLESEFQNFSEHYKKHCINFFSCLCDVSITSEKNKILSDLLPISPPGNIHTQRLDSEELIIEIKDFIKKNCKDDISIQKMGELFHISPNYLSKIFHDRTGIRYIDYVTSFRIETAKNLLTHSGMTIQQISESIGYYSTRHFTKTFKKLTGLLPNEYRETYTSI